MGDDAAVVIRTAFCNSDRPGERCDGVAVAKSAWGGAAAGRRGHVVMKANWTAELHCAWSPQSDTAQGAVPSL